MKQHKCHYYSGSDNGVRIYCWLIFGKHRLANVVKCFQLNPKFLQ